MSTKFDVAAAFGTLGLGPTASQEEVKASYKQLALKHHPDKNPNDPEATRVFQQLGAAYNGLNDHFDRKMRGPARSNDGTSNRPYSGGFSDFAFSGSGGGGGFYSFGFGGPFGFREYPDEDDDDDDDSSDDEDAYYNMGYDEDMEDELNFFRFLFEEAMNERMRDPPFSRRRRHRTETSEQFQARLARAREEQATANARRVSEDKLRKERRAQLQEEETRRAAERRKQKAEGRAAAYADSVARAETQAKAALERRQAIRSSAFTAARKGDAAAVRKSVYEDSVDAAGPEGLKDSEFKPSGNPKETLLHIAVEKGDKDLVSWLVDHNAEPDERDSRNQTAFHRAIFKGFIPIIQYFLDAFPSSSEDSKAVLRAPKSDSILRLAVSSANPDVVYAVLDADLVDMTEVPGAWKWLDNVEKKSHAGQQWHAVRQVLREIEGWTPPTTPVFAPKMMPNATQVPPTPRNGGSKLSSIGGAESMSAAPKSGLKKNHNNRTSRSKAAPAGPPSPPLTAEPRLTPQSTPGPQPRMPVSASEALQPNQGPSHMSKTTPAPRIPAHPPQVQSYNGPSGQAPSQLNGSRGRGRGRGRGRSRGQGHGGTSVQSTKT